ncbi:MAG: aminotransferase class I/II-fold pyridoxal phosphate-dependent enzyme [Phascolarctobacterium sp.]|nr:aminotransferase class I/II-fold pyridoxal phosphate-dependent enzyme [Phascolarctobacterium sp.]
MKNRMPLLEALLKYKEENIYPFHTPGHKGGRGMEKMLRQALGGSTVLDVSLMSELDDIHRPKTYIARAQAMAARVYGSDACFWAVNGTTQAVHAMMLAALRPREKVLLPRNIHRSVAGGLILSDLEAVFLRPDYCERFDIHTQVSPEAIEGVLKKNSAIKAVLLTSPNYYGVAAETKKIADICHKYNRVLLVDEAHGPHLGFSKKLPPSAMQCGADACVQSTHKILGAMSQCSMLHIKGKRILPEFAADAMSLLTTTSPNYLLMASLDAVRYQIEAKGGKMAETAISAADKLREVIARHKGLRILKSSDCGGLKLDKTKVTVSFKKWGISGMKAAGCLRENGIAVELADAWNVLFLVTFADTGRDFKNALLKIDASLSKLEKGKRQALAEIVPEMPETTAAMKMRDVFYADREKIPFAPSSGRICGEQVSFYPPGIPVLLPGEIITDEIIGYCRRMKETGISVSGPADSSLKTIRVIK